MDADGTDQHPLAPNAYAELWPSWIDANKQALSFQQRDQEFTAHESFLVGFSYLDIFVGRLIRW